VGRTIYPHDGYADKRLRSISQDDDPKEWLLEIITPDLLTLCGKRLDIWGGGCFFGNGATRRSLGGPKLMWDKISGSEGG
jgi:hypothetical protein